MERLGEFRAAERDLQGLRDRDPRPRSAHRGLEGRPAVRRSPEGRSAGPGRTARGTRRGNQGVRSSSSSGFGAASKWVVSTWALATSGTRPTTSSGTSSSTWSGGNVSLPVLGGPQYDEAFSRVAALERRLDQRDAEMAAVVKRRVSQMLATVDEETANLRRYRAALGSLEGETEDVVGRDHLSQFQPGPRSLLRPRAPRRRRQNRCLLGTTRRPQGPYRHPDPRAGARAASARRRVPRRDGSESGQRGRAMSSASSARIARSGSPRSPGPAPLPHSRRSRARTPNQRRPTPWEGATDVSLPPFLQDTGKRIVDQRPPPTEQQLEALRSSSKRRSSDSTKREKHFARPSPRSCAANTCSNGGSATVGTASSSRPKSARSTRPARARSESSRSFVRRYPNHPQVHAGRDVPFGRALLRTERRRVPESLRPSAGGPRGRRSRPQKTTCRASPDFTPTVAALQDLGAAVPRL